MSISGAVVSVDAEFRDALKRALAGSGQPILLGAEITVPFTGIGDPELKQLLDARPVVVFIDFEHDPQLGVRLTEFLADAHPEICFVAAGQHPTPEVLMSAMRAGVSEYLTKPLTPDALASALGRMERKLGAAAVTAQEPGKLLVFFSAKGGAGTTTVAANVGVHLHQLTGKSTLLADLDLELGEIGLYLGVQPRFNFVDLVHNFHRLDAELLASYIERHESGVHLLAAPFQPEKAEGMAGEQVRQILRFLKQNYEYIVADTPHGFSPATIAALEQADQIFMVTNVDLPSLRNIKRSLPMLERLTGGTLKERLRLIVNRYHVDNAISLEEVSRTLGLKVYWKLSNEYATVINAINAGEPMLLGGRTSTLINEMRALGAEIAGVKLDGKKPSGLRRLFTRAG